ncbi:MAG: hypothetical protein AAB116_16990 [Candidatus Poribacteria bacterium]
MHADRGFAVSNQSSRCAISFYFGASHVKAFCSICRRMKLRGMRWSRDKADNVLNIRILILNGEWNEFWKKHKAA